MIVFLFIRFMTLLLSCTELVNQNAKDERYTQFSLGNIGYIFKMIKKTKYDGSYDGSYDERSEPMRHFIIAEFVIPCHENKFPICLWKIQSQNLKFQVIQHLYSLEDVRKFENWERYLERSKKKCVFYGPVLLEIFLGKLHVMTLRKPISHDEILHLVDHCTIPESITRMDLRKIDYNTNAKIQAKIIDLLQCRFKKPVETCNHVIKILC
jgi:hypothetical protein